MIALLLALLAAAPADWLLVRGAAERVGTLGHERIREVYLPDVSCRIVAADAAPEEPRTSRLVVGDVEDNPLARELCDALGIEVAADGLRYAGRAVRAGQGLALRVPDPDGGGRLWLFTGPDADGAFACLTSALGPDTDGWVHLAHGRILARGSLAYRVDAARPVVLRLDLQALWLAEEAQGSADDRALRIGRGLVGEHSAFGRVGFSDLVDYARWLLGPGAAQVEAARSFFGQRDLGAEAAAAWERCVTELGPAPLAPAIHLLLGPTGATNACVFDPDPITGRPRMMLNVCALARGRHFGSAALHESVHVLQDPGGETLAARALREGVATALAQWLDPTLSDADALFWTEEQLAAAVARHDALAALFLERADSTDRALHDPFLLLEARPPEVPGAPSRSGYYLAWHAARLWLDAHPDDPRGLLRVDSSELVERLR